MESGENKPLLPRSNSGNNIEMVTIVNEVQNPEQPAGKTKKYPNDDCNDDCNDNSKDDSNDDSTDDMKGTKNDSNNINDSSNSASNDNAHCSQTPGEHIS